VRGPLPLIPKGPQSPLRESGVGLPVGKPPAASQTVKILIDTGIRDFKQNIEMEIRATATPLLNWAGDGLAIGLFEDAVELTGNCELDKSLLVF